MIFFSEKLRTNLDAIRNLWLEFFTKRSPCFLLIFNAKHFILFFGSLYLKIDSRTALERMLERGDDIHEAYRRTVSDEGQFTGFEDELKHDMDKINKAGKMSSYWIVDAMYLDTYNVFKHVDGLLDTHIELINHFNLLSK
jgi:hypothetical protein